MQADSPGKGGATKACVRGDLNDEEAVEGRRGRRKWRGNERKEKRRGG